MTETVIICLPLIGCIYSTIYILHNNNIIQYTSFTILTTVSYMQNVTSIIYRGEMGQLIKKKKFVNKLSTVCINIITIKFLIKTLSKLLIPNKGTKIYTGIEE